MDENKLSERLEITSFLGGILVIICQISLIYNQQCVNYFRFIVKLLSKKDAILR